MKMYKNCDGVKIDKCKDCDYPHLPYCKKINKYNLNTEIRNIFTIPSWCPLEDYKE